MRNDEQMRHLTRTVKLRKNTREAERSGTVEQTIRGVEAGKDVLATKMEENDEMENTIKQHDQKRKNDEGTWNAQLNRRTTGKRTGWPETKHRYLKSRAVVKLVNELNEIEYTPAQTNPSLRNHRPSYSVTQTNMTYRDFLGKESRLCLWKKSTRVLDENTILFHLQKYSREEMEIILSI